MRRNNNPLPSQFEIINLQRWMLCCCWWGEESALNWAASPRFSVLTCVAVIGRLGGGE